MVKSKRKHATIITKVKKRVTSETKKNDVAELRNAICLSKYIYVVRFKCIPTNVIQNIRQELKPSVLYMGKNRIMQVAIGATEETALKPNLHKLSVLFTSGSSLLCSDKDIEDIRKIAENYNNVPSFARAGEIASDNVTITQEMIDEKRFVSSIEPHLRNLGLKTKLDNGKIYLLEPYEVCSINDELDSRACKLLDLFDIKLAKQQFSILAKYDSTTNEVDIYNENVFN